MLQAKKVRRAAVKISCRRLRQERLVVTAGNSVVKCIEMSYLPEKITGSIYFGSISFNGVHECSFVNNI